MIYMGVIVVGLLVTWINRPTYADKIEHCCTVTTHIYLIQTIRMHRCSQGLVMWADQAIWHNTPPPLSPPNYHVCTG